ncbi:glutamate--tRNA ligase [Candidatus Sumerlaeota bacterium]|nr:glutamate--tRNA ligase [Candidatus Sumerlaeota bacterium]
MSINPTRPMRVRFAPSPTGFLHLGGARTALFNWLLAKQNNGVFILRIEDTDAERSTEESTGQILDSLQWLGLQWDEGPYFQSQRLELYREHIERLYKEGKIYPAFESPEELEAERERALAEKRNPIYNRASLRLPKEEVDRRLAAGERFVWRFKVPDEGHTDVPETLMSGAADCKFENAAMGDFVISRAGTMKEPGWPLYNFCCVVDDALMGISHVIRGQEHLSNAARQVLLYQAFGYPVPTFTHLPLIMKNNKKMSKRDKDADPAFPVSVSGRRDLGYLQEATVNFISLLGCSYPMEEEIFPVDVLIKNFNLDRLQKSNANFDEDKYLFQNAWYLRNLPREDVVERVKPFIEAAGYDWERAAPVSHGAEKWLADIIGLEIERCKLLSEFPAALSYFFIAPSEYEQRGVTKIFHNEGVPELLDAVAEALLLTTPFTKEAMEDALRRLGDAKGLGFGKIAQPVRLAATGRTASPGLFDVLEHLGREEVIRRLVKAKEWLQSNPKT